MRPPSLPSSSIERIVLREIRLPFVDFFETSFGRVEDKRAVLVEVIAEGLSGWGECVAGEGPFFSYEDYETAWYILSNFLVPALLEEGRMSPDRFVDGTRRIRGHPMAKAAVESALWDWSSRAAGEPLWKCIGGARQDIPCGVSIGIQDHPNELLRKIEREVEAGYRRIKVKIRPGWDLKIVQMIRKAFPDVPLMADANAAYRLDDREHLAGLDEFDLMMIEQPLSHEDLIEHSRLARRLATPICLDESIGGCQDAELAFEIGACSIVNVKQGRVGGLTEARRLHDVCLRRKVPVWCGGMLETGIGRAHNVALSTLPNFTLPGDVSASARYFSRDVVDPPVEVVDGVIRVPDRPGIGYDPDVQWIEANSVRKATFKPEGSRKAYDRS